MFGHSDKTVRAEGQALVHVLYQYIGAGIEPALADLKPVQVKELHEAFEALEKDGKGKGTLKPERMTRAQAREAEAAAEAGEEAPEAEDDAGTLACSVEVGCAHNIQPLHWTILEHSLKSLTLAPSSHHHGKVPSRLRSGRNGRRSWTQWRSYSVQLLASRTRPR